MVNSIIEIHLKRAAAHKTWVSQHVLAIPLSEIDTLMPYSYHRTLFSEPLFANFLHHCGELDDGALSLLKKKARIKYRSKKP